MAFDRQWRFRCAPTQEDLTVQRTGFMEEERTLDCRGLACPQPVIQTREALEGLGGDWLRVLLDNEASFTNVRRFAESQGHQVQAEEGAGTYQLRIRRGDPVGGFSAAPAPCEAPQVRRLVVYVSSQGIGRGDEALGAKLMAAYLDTLSQFAREISHVILINAGVKLAVEGSPVLDQLRGLEKMGAQVLSCGTCLNHFGLPEKLQVGSITNMLAILEILSGAGKVLSL